MAVGVTVLLLIPGAMALNFGYLYAILSYFLVERDTTPDTSAWREECTVEGFSLDPVRQGIGSIKDTVVALRTGDASEVFRRVLPMYARSQVAFLGDGYFAYSDVEGTRSRTRVLRITD